MSFEMRLSLQIGVIIIVMLLLSVGLAFFLDWYLNKKEK